MSEIRSGNSGNLNKAREFDENCENLFLDELGDEMTGACMVPVNLPKKEIRNIIKRAKKWFYKKTFSLPIGSESFIKYLIIY